MRTWCWLAGLVVLAGGLVLLPGRAEEKAKEKALPADLARVPAKAAALLSVRVADLWASEPGKEVRTGLGKMEKQVAGGLAGALGLEPAEVERLTAVVADFRSEPVLIVRAKKPVDKKVLARLVRGGTEEKYAGKEVLANKHQAATLLGDRVYAFGSKSSVEELLDTKPGDGAGDLASAVALAAKGHTLVVGVNHAKLPQEEEFAPEKLGPFAPLLKAKETTLVADLGGKLTGQLRMRFGSADDAKAGEKALQAARKAGLNGLAELKKALKKEEVPQSATDVVLGPVREALKAGKLTRDNSDLSATVELKLEAKAFGKAVQAAVPRVQEAARRAQSANNLKQLGLAMHNYADTYGGTLPAHAIYSGDGKPLLSWRVQILPFIEGDQLYKQFKLDEPWDSKHNKKLLDKMPITYLTPTEKPAPKGYTYYQAFVGKGAAFEGKKGLRFPADFPDGTSNTIWFAEGAKAVPWTKPEDLVYQPGKPLPKLGGAFSKGFNAAFCDGSVRFLRKTIKERTLRLYITRNDGEVIPNDDGE
jgi:prepilin-type processing-associated H-X9-DG protein